MTISTIPLSKLIHSPRNVRKIGGQSIDDLAASIEANGLLQNLTVVEGAKGKYEVVAGGRRLTALQKLAKEKKIAKDFPVPCLIRSAEEAAELSLTENVVRVAMHPADQFDAFKMLADGGMSPADIAARFGVTEKLVEQRLKLARVSPKLMEVFRRDGMKIDQLMAFTLTDDHTKQEAAWFDVPEGWQRRADEIRQRLTHTKLSASDRRVKLIGLDAYLAAGGTVTRDLFSEADRSYLDDTSLVDRLFNERLAQLAEEVRAEGWGWVKTHNESFWPYQHGLKELNAPERPYTAEEQAELDRLTAELEQLQGQYDEMSEDDEGLHELQCRIEEAEDAIENLQELDRADWSAFDKGRAGAVIALDHHDGITITRGLVARDDAKAVSTGSTASASLELPTPAKKEKPEFSASLLEDLTAHRTMAMRVTMANDPAVALDTLVWTLAMREFCEGTAEKAAAKIHLTSHFPGQNKLTDSKAGQEWNDIRDRWADTIPGKPDDLWEWVRSAATITKLDLLAFLVATSINVVQERGNPAIPNSHQVHAALGLDMADYWEADAEFLDRISKDQILGALGEAVSSSAKGIHSAKKKRELVKAAEKELSGKRWLPKPLRLPDAATAEPLADAEPTGWDEDEIEQDEAA
ncbi:ParB N-terminal domain-containing protein (plasmid) [Skermanella rosea]|uniref:ParB/RepB/Spo0J family partition protein n=1 Tax=Skermanella rosea TaxID=1817965 RepID=UPI0019341492|nr:ParB/RepB/Spo0J family partition protein [Skermanella rosea]UEM08007.1 ParB N-terminal domain-containing protein [Skermanella rosea]